MAAALDRQALFDDRDVRDALFRAIDREAIAAQLMEGTVRVADSPLNPTSPYHNPDARFPGYDPEHHWGGVLYLFVRGISPEHAPGCGVYFDRPDPPTIARLSSRASVRKRASTKPTRSSTT